MLSTRHTLVYVDDAARKVLLPALLDSLPAPMRYPALEAQVGGIFLKDRIPGIACRPTGPVPKGGGQLGFSFPIRLEEQRVRAAVAVSVDQVTAGVTPWEVMGLAEMLGDTAHPVIPALSAICDETGCKIGLIGSLAMQVVTGLRYLRPGSDVDIVVRGKALDSLMDFHAELGALSARTGLKIDAEVELSGSIGVKLSELVSSADQVLGKTISGVELISRNRLSEIMSPSHGSAKTEREYENP
ncbi:phosphoribosyl-dephospho-CoA transferase [Rhodobacter aestuarii]|uniref:Phosphoribosyl-dephospho-CoA transferase n=1 Tax=Rhodobacter aestuarii TaxID=453582 RepID=A0A1N7KB38_9RHOB|nr:MULTISPECIES: malonate decarboxylase holo-[acyl-carrier-protein] synthase [Rhodobacter]PTV95779.1 phosphoribosyl-dephospho-CoA transferase [Rhodobacter aestuarii]SIS58749.1 phosphoribosyl-dephospho-CoA transferase [Rhodobacter aestuarii]SOC17309.1 phosphoribosyl-dephospho-CoA transferase [Rhodobacter sp. JA431]